MKTLVLVFDGLADLPDNTPLKLAKKPNIDWLAANGVVGDMVLLPRKMWTEEGRTSISHKANIALLGYDIKKFSLNRGPLEAIGDDLPYKNGWLAVRCNFATVQDGRVVDRHAGRSTYGLDELTRYISTHVDIGVPYIFKHTYGHRAVLVIKKQLSDRVSGNDPYANGKAVKEIKPLDTRARESARLLNEFVSKVAKIIKYHPVNEERMNRKILPANYLLVREPGNHVIPLEPSFGKRYRVKPVIIAENGVIKATCMLAGFDAITIPKSFTVKKGLKFIFSRVEEALTEYSFVYAHIKWTDEAAHDGSCKRKKRIIETVDKYLEDYKYWNGVLVLTTDHITSCITRKHEYGAVPVLVYGKGKDRVKRFDEMSVKKGKLAGYTARKLWRFVLKK